MNQITAEALKKNTSCIDRRYAVLREGLDKPMGSG